MDNWTTCDVKPQEERAHALLSASGASRWLSCTASARYEENFPDSSSPYAEEGTLAHELGEVLVKQYLGQMNHEEYEKRMEEIQSSSYYNPEMYNYMMDYGHFIIKRLEEVQRFHSNAVAELEVKLDFSKWAPEGFGTGDCVIVASKTIEIIDLKYGKGYKVEAENNPQMRLYALGVISRYNLIYDFETVKTTIFQPRLSETPSSEELSVAELLAWAEKEVVPNAKAAFDGNGVFVPTESNCKFCRAKQVCGARSEHSHEIISNFYYPDQVQQVSLDEAGYVLTKAKDLRGWLSDLENLVMKSLSSGTPVEGWKLVEGRSNRTFKNKEDVKSKLLESGLPLEEFMEENLFSITVLEKKLGKAKVKELLGSLITKPKGKPTLVQSSDRRKEINNEVEVIAMFDDEFEE